MRHMVHLQNYQELKAQRSVYFVPPPHKCDNSDDDDMQPLVKDEKFTGIKTPKGAQTNSIYDNDEGIQQIPKKGNHIRITNDKEDGTNDES